MPIASPALTRAAPLQPQPLGPAALAAAFLQFLVAVIAYATAAIDQIDPRTQAERAKLRRLNRGLRLARAMVTVFDATPPAPAPTILPDDSDDADPTPNPWFAAVAWGSNNVPPIATLFQPEPPAFPGAAIRVPVPALTQAHPLAARIPHAAHDPPWITAVPTHHPSRRRALPPPVRRDPIAPAWPARWIAPRFWCK